MKNVLGSSEANMPRNKSDEGMGNGAENPEHKVFKKNP